MGNSRFLRAMSFLLGALLIIWLAWVGRDGVR